VARRIFAGHDDDCCCVLVKAVCGASSRGVKEIENL